MNHNSFFHAARGVEGFVSNGSVSVPDPVDALIPIVALVTGDDRIGGGCSAIELAACVLNASVVAIYVDVEALLEAVLRGSVQHVICSCPSTMGDDVMSAWETFHVLASLGVAVFSADRGWLGPDDFGDGVLQPPGIDPVSPTDAAAPLPEECA